VRCLAIAAAMLLSTIITDLAVNNNNQGGNNNNQGGNYYGAPGPIGGAGLSTLAMAGIGYEVYRQTKRPRRAD
jgi:hypothetical protein